MYLVNDDLSIYVTRGDILCLNVSATQDDSGEPYEFQPGDIVRMKVYGKRDAENVVMQKDFPVVAKTDSVGILLTEDDTKFGEVISKPRDYWYEIELNPYTNPQTIVGYDEDGAKIFKLFPEGKDLKDEPTKPEDIPVVDADLDMVSSRPVENRTISRAITLLKNDLNTVDERLSGMVKATESANKDLAAEVAAEKVRFDNLIAPDNKSLSQTLGYVESITEATKLKYTGRIDTDGVFANVKITLHEANLIYGGTEIDMFIIPTECRPWETGLIHTEDGLEYRIKYDGTKDRYYMSIKAQDSVTVAPSGAGTVTMSYKLSDYEVKDIRVGADGMTYGTAGESVRLQVERLRNDIRGIIEDGNPTMNTYVNWVIGGVTSGAVVPTMLNRIATDNILKFNRDVTLLIDSGYRMGVHLLDEAGNFAKDSGWKTAEYPVPKNTPFRIVIARVNETTDRADIHEFSSALSIQDCSTAQARDLYDTINSIDKTFALEQFPGTEPFNQVMYVDIRKGELELTPSFFCTVNLGYADGTEEHISDGVVENETFTFTLTRPIKYIRCFAQSVPLNVHLRVVNRFTKIEDSVAENRANVAENIANVARIEKEIAALGQPARKKCWLSSAHRGFVDSVLKENCLAAYYNAYLNGADMIETDARLSSDGVLIVNHDPTVTGVNANGETVTYTVAETPASQICALTLCADDKWGTQYVPTLAQVLHMAYNTGLIVNIDLKDGARSAEAVAKMVFAYGMQGRVIYALNGAGMAGMSKILAIDPDARFIDMVGRYYGAEDYAERGKRCFAYTSDISAVSVNAIREKGFLLALTSLHSGNFVAAVGYSPDMCEYLHTSDFRAIEDAYFADLKLY